MKKLVFTVTNDITYDQRMQRICTSLADNGYAVLLVGRKLPSSVKLTRQPYKQKRLRCFFNSGFLFYAEYNLRLCIYLLLIKTDLICAIDLDTIVPCYLASAIRNKKRVYDAHELFTEQKEIVTRKLVHAFWLMIEKKLVPAFAHGYTVNNFIVEELYRRYKVKYAIIRNLPVHNHLPKAKKEIPHFIIYQGAVNEGRSFETLIPAMQQVNAPLKIYGNGNFFSVVQRLINDCAVNDKVQLKGYALPANLKDITPAAYIALTLFEDTGLNQYYSLSNRFFDYIMAGVPQLCVNYPEYAFINNKYQVAYMINDTRPETIATALNHLLADTVLYEQLCNNCLLAREQLNWQQEEKLLVKFYHHLFRT